MKRFVVVGLGNFGASVAERLYSMGHDVVAIDLDEDAVDRIASHVSRAAVGDGRHKNMLDQIGAREADVAIVSTGEDITASILALLALRDLNVQDVYVKVISDDHARVMQQLGVRETIFPERDSALNLANRLVNRTVLNYVQMSDNLSIQEMVVLDAWKGHTLRDLSLRSEYGITVVAIRDTSTNSVEIPPDPDTALNDTHTLLIAGAIESLNALTSDE